MCACACSTQAACSHAECFATIACALPCLLRQPRSYLLSMLPEGSGPGELQQLVQLLEPQLLDELRRWAAAGACLWQQHRSLCSCAPDWAAAAHARRTHRLARCCHCCCHCCSVYCELRAFEQAQMGLAEAQQQVRVWAWGKHTPAHRLLLCTRKAVACAAYCQCLASNACAHTCCCRRVLHAVCAAVTPHHGRRAARARHAGGAGGAAAAAQAAWLCSFQGCRSRQQQQQLDAASSALRRAGKHSCGC